jgi:hypothetical protein
MRLDFDERRSCGRKVRYSERIKAQSTARRHRLHAYSCIYCKGWHIGHRPPAEVLAKLREYRRLVTS